MPLKITVRSVLPAREIGDLIVVGVPALGGASKKKNQRSPLDGFDRALGGAFGRLLKKGEFKGKRDQQVSIATLGKVNADRLILIGLGDIGKLSAGDVRTFAAKAARAANRDKSRRLVLGVPAGLEDRLREIVEGLELGAYRFAKYLSGDRRPKADLTQVTICLLGTMPVDSKHVVDIGQAVGAGVNLSRDLSNEPPNVLYPETFAAAAQAMAKEVGLKIQVFDFKEIQKRGMRLLQAVGQGSERKPVMVHFSHVPAGTAAGRRRLVFVGKGITFDSGGISIKPSAGMGEMKHDMSGAANIVGLMQIVGRLKPNVEVHGIFAAAENMPDGGAYRPGDIWPSLDGKSVEITNTDAEGRLILADALAYARVLEPDLLVDNATLTGACVVALGNPCSGWYTTNEATAEEFQASVKNSGELMWRMPMIDELKEQLKSDSADISHTNGGRYGGSIVAALFLREFIGNVQNWVHCDIAGPAMGDRVRGWDPKGGTGHGVLTFLDLIERAARNTVAAAPAATTGTATPTPTGGAKAKRASKKSASKKRAPAKAAPAKAAPAKAAPAKAAPPRAVPAAATEPAPAKKVAPPKVLPVQQGAQPAAAKPAVTNAATPDAPPAQAPPVPPAAQVRPKPVSAPSVAPDEPWTKAELTAIRVELQAEVGRLRGEIETSETDLADRLRDGGDGAGDDQADAGTKTFEREHEMSLANNARDLLVQTEHALARIEAGTYGRCENCGNPIGKLRLRANPRATLCVSCKQREERR
jgi:leucyl aminopeptidase